MRRSIRTKVILALGAVCSVSGCSGNGVYSYTQSEDGLAMKAPITHSVRVTLDEPKGVVTLLQDAVDSDGFSDRQIRKFGGYNWSHCDIFDEKNWSCDLRGSDGEVLERPAMKDGKLTWYYWGTNRTYQEGFSILGVAVR